MYDFESNAKQFLNFLKFLGKLSRLEQRSFIDNATNKHINMLVNFIRLCSSGKVLCRDQKMFSQLAKYTEVFFDLKMSKKPKTNTTERVNAFKAILHDKHGLLNLLAPYLEQCLGEYEIGHQLGINPVIILPKMFPHKRTTSKRRIPRCEGKEVVESRDQGVIVVKSTDEKDIKTEVKEEERDFNAMTVQN